MLTLSSWYPNIDLNESFYEDDSCRIGMNGQNYYLISKLDKTIIVYEKSHPQKIRTFIDLVSVDSLRCNSFKKLYHELGDTNGSGKSTLQASHIRFLLEGGIAQAEFVENFADQHRGEIKLLKKYYENDCCTHLSVSVSQQIKQFMKYSKFYDIRIKISNDFGMMTQQLIIIDEDTESIYWAIVHDDVVYFTSLPRYQPIRENIAKNQFRLSYYYHYTSVSGCFIDLFKSPNLIMKSYYDPILKTYTIDGFRKKDDDELNEFVSVYQEISRKETYSIDFIFDFIFENELVHYPSNDFIKTLRDMSILGEDEMMRVEHVKTYEMAII
jgi:hypothetical protein